MTDAAEREMLYDLVRRFAREQIAPHVTAWDEAGEFPRQLYLQAAELGLLGIGYPEELGGTAATHGLRAALWLALCRYGGSGGVLASLLSHNIGLPPVVALGSDALKQQVVPDVLLGRKIAALARWPRVCDRGREDLHHLGHACGLDHGGGAHGRGERCIRHLPDPGAWRQQGFETQPVAQDGLAMLGHGPPVI